VENRVILLGKVESMYESRCKAVACTGTMKDILVTKQ